MKFLWSLLLLGVFSASSGAAELKLVDIAVGDGPQAGRHDTVLVHYSGWLEDGTRFDSSRDRAEPFRLVLGMGQVIPGWEMGLQGMRVGGKRELLIPPQLAYGPRGAGGVIPPNATLRFEVELLALDPPPFTNVDNGELQDLLAAGLKIIDIRRPEEWRQTGVVEGSHLLTAFNARGDLVRSFPAQLKRIVANDEPFIMICRTGSRTGHLARALAEQGGYQRVYNVTDGITHWIAEGGKIRKDCPANRSGAQC